MSKVSLSSNPFKVFTPEGMSAQDAVDLFVEVSEFVKIQDAGNTMLNGPRGSGKSMLFRYLMPDCQMIARSLDLGSLPFFAVLVSIKNTTPYITELRRLEFQSTRTVLNEHLLTSFVASKLFQSLIDNFPDDPAIEWVEPTVVFFRSVVQLFSASGLDVQLDESTAATCQAMLVNCKELCEQSYNQMTLYAKRLSFGDEGAWYSGALCDFTTFLLPLIGYLQLLPYFPNGPTYILMDDADHLSLDQTRILNAWIAARADPKLSIKVSTQYGYKTFATFSKTRIRSPHDFQEISIADVYTTKHSTYLHNVRCIVEKRLQKAEIEKAAHEFFPVDPAQEAEIESIRSEIRTEWPKKGYTKHDDVLRYAVPEYIRRLGGSRKSTSTYSYAGFEQLVHISSGQVRYFLEPAAEMYDEEKAYSQNSVSFIRPQVQTSIVRREAETVMFGDFDSLKNDLDQSGLSLDTHHEHIDRLRNLIRFLGNFFFQKLVSEDSERRVFSVAISNEPDKDILRIFDLGVRYGYFHRSSIGNKEGTGRIRLYILSRRLAPHFNLDPSSFAGYQFVTNDILRQAMLFPNRVLSFVRRHSFRDLESNHQLDLFES